MTIFQNKSLQSLQSSNIHARFCLDCGEVLVNINVVHNLRTPFLRETCDSCHCLTRTSWAQYYSAPASILMNWYWCPLSVLAVYCTEYQPFLGAILFVKQTIHNCQATTPRTQKVTDMTPQNKKGLALKYIDPPFLQKKKTGPILYSLALAASFLI